MALTKVLITVKIQHFHLYWNCLAHHKGDEQKAISDVRKKYFDNFAKTKDLHFIQKLIYKDDYFNWKNKGNIVWLMSYWLVFTPRGQFNCNLH